MGNLASALTHLTGLTVTGITNYAFASMPIAPNYADLPALVLEFVPTYDTPTRALDINLTALGTVLLLQHLLLCKDEPLAQAQVSAVSHVETYLAALVADDLMASYLVEPLTIPSIQFGGIERGGQIYYGVRLIHRWVISL